MRISAILPALAGIALAACAATPGGHAATNATAPGSVAPAATAPATSAPPAPVAPDPKGKYSGSCDYSLGNGTDGNYKLIGEIDVTNTGNVGIVARVRITWPQEGYSPIRAIKTVRVPEGAKLPVRFHMPVDSNVIDLLQSWQTGHDLRDGCTYHVAITDTFGTPQ